MSPKDGQAAREYATKDGWLVHFTRVGDENAWDTCRERHIEIEAGQKELDIRQPWCILEIDGTIVGHGFARKLFYPGGCYEKV